MDTNNNIYIINIFTSIGLVLILICVFLLWMMFNKLSTELQAIFIKVKDYLISIYNVIKTNIQKFITIIKNFIIKIWGYIKRFFIDLYNKGVSLVNDTKEIVNDTIDIVKDVVISAENIVISIYESVKMYFLILSKL